MSSSDEEERLSCEGELSASTLLALQAHLAEAEAATGREEADVAGAACVGGGGGEESGRDAWYNSEDFGFSQFWYDEATSERLASELLERSGHGRIAILSAPAAFRGLLKLAPEYSSCSLFEYDRRFERAYPDQFVFYDFNAPLDVPASLHGVFDFVLADPPYLNPDTMNAFVRTMRLLAKSSDTPLMLLTGAVLRREVEGGLGFRPHAFVPTFKSKLNNPFHCYANYETERLGGWLPPLEDEEEESVEVGQLAGEDNQER